MCGSVDGDEKREKERTDSSLGRRQTPQRHLAPSSALGRSRRDWRVRFGASPSPKSRGAAPRASAS